MKLEYLPDGSPDCPILRIYDFDEPAAQHLQGLFSNLAIGSVWVVALHELPGVESVAGCTLTLRVTGRDRGVIQVGDSNSFECHLRQATWEQLADLTEPFCTVLDPMMPFRPATLISRLWKALVGSIWAIPPRSVPCPEPHVVHRSGLSQSEGRLS